jgi:hypothetical protein
VLLEKRLKGIFLIHDVRPDVSVKLLGRYGMHRYDEAFSERNTKFWTIGPHVDWQCGPEDEAPRSSLLRRSSHFGYEGRKLRGMRRRRIKLGLSYHYERGLEGVERNGAYENIYQGELTLAYRLVHLVCLVTLVYLVQPNKRNKPDKPNNKFGVISEVGDRRHGWLRQSRG